MTQTELMRESFRHNQEMNELLQKQEELQERLSEEARAREQLALELHRAEGEFVWIMCFYAQKNSLFKGRNEWSTHFFSMDSNYGVTMWVCMSEWLQKTEHKALEWKYMCACVWGRGVLKGVMGSAVWKGE